MNSYANGFFCAANADNEEVTISFMQNRPVQGAGGKIQPVNEEVAGVVMNMKSARMLAQLLDGLLDSKKE